MGKTFVTVFNAPIAKRPSTWLLVTALDTLNVLLGNITCSISFMNRMGACHLNFFFFKQKDCLSVY